MQINKKKKSSLNKSEVVYIHASEFILSPSNDYTTNKSTIKYVLSDHNKNWQFTRELTK